jgi:hypothetical protein
MLNLVPLYGVPRFRALILSRYTLPEPDLQLLLMRLKLELPAQPPRRITAASVGKEVAT